MDRNPSSATGSPCHPTHPTHSFIHSLIYSCTQPAHRAGSVRLAVIGEQGLGQTHGRTRTGNRAWREVSQVKEDRRPVQVEDRASGYLETQESGATWGPVGVPCVRAKTVNRQKGRGCWWGGIVLSPGNHQGLQQGATCLESVRHRLGGVRQAGGQCRGHCTPEQEPGAHGGRQEETTLRTTGEE